MKKQRYISKKRLPASMMEAMPEPEAFDSASALKFETYTGPDPVKSPEHAWWSRPAEFSKVLIRIGSSPMARLRWLVEDFARRRDYRDPHNVSASLPDESTPETVACEVLIFLLYQGGPGPSVYTSGSSAPNLPAKMLRALSVAVDEGVRRLLAGATWHIDVPPKMAREIRIETVPLGREKGKRQLITSWADRGQAFTARFLLYAQDLVASEFESIAKCAGCDDIFVRDDKRQTYCRPNCAGNVRMRKFRQGKKR